MKKLGVDERYRVVRAADRQDTDVRIDWAIAVEALDDHPVVLSVAPRDVWRPYAR